MQNWEPAFAILALSFELFGNHLNALAGARPMPYGVYLLLLNEFTISSVAVGAFTCRFAHTAMHDGKEAHLVNTWNTYLIVTQDGRLLFPAGGMNVTEKNLGKDNRVQMTVGSPEVKGLRGPGAGYLIRGTASFLVSGPDFLAVKGKFPWARAAVEVQVASAAQTL